jgi:hypothetical protein
VPEAAKSDEFLGLAHLCEQRLGFFGWNQPVVVRHDEEDRSRRYFVDDPFGMEAQSVVDDLERQLIYGGRVTAARGRSQVGGLAIGRQHLRAIGHGRLAIKDTLLSVSFGAVEKIAPFVHIRHPAGRREHRHQGATLLRCTSPQV